MRQSFFAVLDLLPIRNLLCRLTLTGHISKSNLKLSKNFIKKDQFVKNIAYPTYCLEILVKNLPLNLESV